MANQLKARAGLSPTGGGKTPSQKLKSFRQPRVQAAHACEEGQGRMACGSPFVGKPQGNDRAESGGVGGVAELW